ncbi:MAG TPA: multicopper oxidase [Anaerolineales bacterium]|nr:multicopper oxidase [Anaerolineales bacterium]
MISRRDFLKLSGAGLAAIYAATRQRFMLRAYGAAPQPLLPLPGSALPQFVDELPILGSGMVLETGTDITIRMQEFKADIMPSTFIPANGLPYTGTWVWGYQTDGNATPTALNGAQKTYINPVVLAYRDTPTKIKWVNELGTGAGSALYWQDWTDQTLHWAMGTHSMDHYTGQVPAVAHLHGGEVPPQLDGGPDAWFTEDNQQGHAYWAGPGGGGNTSVYNYPNTQEAAPIWFHDHALGITRINVYAGIAGAYLLLDAANPWPIMAGNIIPIVIQDRMFDTNGQLYFPNLGLNPEHPFWVPEFEGDVICINGKVWPKLTVSNKRYAFWFLNGSNARTYDMFLVDQVSKNFGPPIWVIGTDGGLLDTPVKLDPQALKPLPNSLAMMPGERYLAIIDFAGYEGGVVGPNGTAYSGNWLLKNNAKTPFPAGVAPDGNTTGRIMQFVVNPASTLPAEAFDPAGNVPLRQPMIRLVNPASGTPGAGVTVLKTRQLTLNEVMGAAGPLAALVNNSMWDGKRPDGTVINGGFAPFDPDTYYTEFPQEGETELWEIVNLTADAHPIHLHLVQFQLMNRQAFNVNKYAGVYSAAFPGGVYIPEYGPPLAYDPAVNAQSGGKWGGNPDVGVLAKNGKPMWLQGPAKPPLAHEAGWKDTVIMYPGEVTRIMVRWAPTDLPANTPAANACFPFDPNGGHGYVWHCHIIDHEDNEMMRPNSVIPNTNATRTFEDF